jgi:hypothetical protein
MYLFLFYMNNCLDHMSHHGLLLFCLKAQKSIFIYTGIMYFDKKCEQNCRTRCGNHCAHLFSKMKVF